MDERRSGGGEDVEKGVKEYSQSSQFGVGLEEELREELQFVSVQTSEERESSKKQVGCEKNVWMIKHCQIIQEKIRGGGVGG